MDIEKKVYNQHFILMFILMIFILIGREYLNSQVIFLSSFFIWFIIYMLNIRDNKKVFIILRMFILSIPLSFTNIFGSPYSESIISWYNIFFLLIICLYFFLYIYKNKTYFDYISLFSILILIMSIIPLLIGEDLIDGLKQYINTSLLYIFLIMGNSFKYDLNIRDKEQLIEDYINGAIIASIGTILQIILIVAFNVVVGKYQLFGGNRHSFGFLFDDYSFLSLYLVSGAILLYFTTLYKNMLNKKEILKISIILLTSILTSARTGIVAFIVVFIIYTIFRVLDLLRKGSIRSFFLIGMSLIVVMTSFLLVNRTRSSGQFSGSGRGDLNMIAFDKFLHNPILGVGLGNKNYGSMIPHNFILQSLAQGGLLYTIPIIIIFALLLYKAYNRKRSLFYTILCVIIGAMFIPDIFNSRFFPILILLLSLHL